MSGFSPGATATVTGERLDAVETLTVGGDTVPFTPQSDARGTFPVPVFRTCETDGRPVELVARGAGETARHTAALAVVSPLRMQVGESLVLDPDTVACLQFAAADEDYALSVLNARVERSETVRDLLAVRSWTADATTPATSARLGPVRTTEVALADDPDQYFEPYTGQPTLFDPRYTTAEVGDTLDFVRWERVFLYGGCDQDPTTLPADAVRPTIVAAVEGQTVVVVDLRSEHAAYYLSDEGRAWFAQAARIADPLQVPAAKELFGAGFEPLAGADGRHFVIVSPDGGPGRPDGGTWGSEASCALSSETMTTIVGDTPDEFTEAKARVFATVILHEFGHLATAIALGQDGATNGWMEEALAVSFEGVAYRIATGQSTGAVIDSDIGFETTAGMHGSWARLPHWSPFTGTGRYVQGAVLVQYARELYGEAPISDEGRSLYQAYHAGAIPQSDDTSGILGRLAGLVGLSGAELLDQAMLADATDDLVDPAAARAAGLPQIETWSRPYARDAADARDLSRTTNERVVLGAAPGSYDATYLFADGESRGISLTLEVLDGVDAVFRLTRLR